MVAACDLLDALDDDRRAGFVVHAGYFLRRGLGAALRGALDVFLELREARPFGRVQHLATELHGDRRHGVVQAREQRDLDALERLAGFVALLLEHADERRDEAVREQNAEERADECVRDQDAELGGGKPTDSIVCTTPMTAATMPNAGKPSAIFCSAWAGSAPS